MNRSAGQALVVLLLTACSSPSPSQAPQGTPPPSASPRATEAASASPVPTGVQLARANTLNAWWSSDSQWLLIASGVTNGSPAAQSIALHDRTGRVVRTLQGQQACWVDSHTFIVFTGTESLVGSVDSATLTPGGPPPVASGPHLSLDAVSSGHGAVAYPLATALDATARFAVWTPTGTSDSLPGVPLMWSADGRHLAVWHWTRGTAPMVDGWVEVLGWPGLRSELRLPDEATAPPPAGSEWFDPSDSYLYVAGAIVDLASGTVAHLALGFDAGEPAWTSADQLVVPSLGGGDAAVFDVDGRQVASIAGSGDSVTASADGSLVLSWTASEAEPVGVIHGSLVQERVAVPGAMQPPYVVPAPDGSAFVAVWVVDSLNSGAFLLKP